MKTKRRLLPGTKKVLIQLEPEQFEKLKKISDYCMVGMSEIIRRLIANFNEEKI